MITKACCSFSNSIYINLKFQLSRKVSRCNSVTSQLQNNRSATSLPSKEGFTLPHALGSLPSYIKKMRKAKDGTLTPQTTQNTEIINPASSRPRTASAIYKEPSKSLSFSHNLGSTLRYSMNKLPKDPEEEIYQKFLKTKSDLNIQKQKFKVLRILIKKKFKECKELAEQAPNKIVFFEEELDPDCVSDSNNPEKVGELFKDFNNEYQQILDTYLDGLKVQVQEGGDQNLGANEVCFEDFKNKLMDLYNQFVSFFLCEFGTIF